MDNGIGRLTATLESHPATTALAALGALIALGGVIWAVRSARRRGVTGEQAGTLVAAAIATGVSAQGMWVFFGASLHLTISLRIMFFAFLEIMVLTSALRARSAQQVSGTAGIDGVAMWVLTCLSAVLAATDADNAGTVLIRLSAPLVAAWGWERSMALERRRSGGLGGINWRITPERMLIRLGVADPTDRTAGEAAMQRRLIDVALSADRARTLRDTGAGARRVNRARRHLQRVMRRAVEDGGLVDNGRAPRTVLLDNLRILSSTATLLDMDLPNPWTADEQPEPPAAAPTFTALAAQPLPAPGAPLATSPPGTDTQIPQPAPLERSAVSPEPPGVPEVSAESSGVDASSASSAPAAPETTSPAASAPLRSSPAPPADPGNPPDAAPPEAPYVHGAAPQTPAAAYRTSAQPVRRDPAVRDRVQEMRTAGISVTDIAAQLGTSTRTISRILRDLDVESPATEQIPVRPIPTQNPAQAAVSSWHNGFRVLPGGNAAASPATGGAPAATDELPSRPNDHPIEN